MEETTGAADDGGIVEVADDHLTVGGLLQERLLRQARTTVEADLLRTPVTWCLPWEQALSTDDQLDGIVVYARSDQLDDAELKLLERRAAAAVIVAGVEESTVAPATGVPLVLVGGRVGFRELSHLVADLTLARETHLLRYGLTVHRSLVELLYRGSGIAALCHQMARLSGCAVAILDPQYHVLAFEQSHDWVLEPGAVAAAVRTEAEISPIGMDPVHGDPVVWPLRLDGVDATCVVNPILLAGRHDGWVVVVERGAAPHPRDIAEHRVVVEQGATIVGTEMLRMRSVEQAEERARGDFVHALLHGGFATARDLEARAAHYDYPTDGTYGVIVVGDLAGAGAGSVPALSPLGKETARLVPRPDSQTLATVVGEVVAVVRRLPVGRDTETEAASRALVDYATALEQELVGLVHHRVALAYGRPAIGATHIVDSYRDARLALGLRGRLGLDRACGFDDLRVYATLAELAASEQGRSFARDVLAPLRSPRAGTSDIEASVMTYIESGGNLNAAARELHIHRNTMLYKLDRASRALGMDLRKAEHQFAVWLAYKLDLLAETTGVVDRDVNPRSQLGPVAR
jgi:sugar diacid utilization regulator